MFFCTRILEQPLGAHTGTEIIYRGSSASSVSKAVIAGLELDNALVKTLLSHYSPGTQNRGVAEVTECSYRTEFRIIE